MHSPPCLTCTNHNYLESQDTVVYSQKGAGKHSKPNQDGGINCFNPNNQKARVQDKIWKTDHVIYSAIEVQGTQTGKSNNFLPFKT